jgi:predicted DNA-binding protein (MmcQ/YjbR family)
MDIAWVRELCLSFPGATEQEVWANDLTFKVSGKMFAHAVLVPAEVWLSFKASAENFAELTERPGIIPAPYLARAQWVALETKDVLRQDELTRLLREAYDLVVARLPKKMRDALVHVGSGAGKPPASKSRAKKRSRRKAK